MNAEQLQENIARHSPRPFPWWQAGTWPTLGDGYMDLNWIEQGLCQLALLGFPTKLRTLQDGCLKEGVTFTDLKVEFEKEFHELKAIMDTPSLRNNNADRHILYSYHSGGLTLHFDGDLVVTVETVTNEPVFLDRLHDFFEQKLTKAPPKGRAHVLISTKDGIKLMSVGLASVPLERDNYMPDVLKTYDRIVSDLRSAAPHGRVAIFDGPPGTGKTYMVRGLLDEVKDAFFIIVPSNLVEQLSQPGVIPALIKAHESKDDIPLVFVIEDADECLAPRGIDNMSAIANVLNFGDGLLGILMNLRIIATTNAKRADLDEAILRPGRLSAIARVDKLDPKTVDALYLKLTGKSLPEDQKNYIRTLAEVYSLAKDNGWTPPLLPKKKVGFVPDVFYDEQNEGPASAEED